MASDDTLRDAHATAPDDPRVQPVEMNLDRSRGLTIRWADGATHFYPLTDLRRQCPCATCRDEREKPRPPATLTSLPILPPGAERAAQVVDAGLVGRYAIHITWGDGHSTGIYDFRYLRTIAPRG
ncbi:MAG: DUF971 domain-containing protein [Phycisphaerae bacterium]